MNGLEVALGHPAERDAALVGDDADPDARVVEAADRLRGAGQELELLGVLDVVALRRLDVDRPVAVEKREPDHSTWDISASTSSQTVCATSM